MIYSVVKIQVNGLTFSWFGINPFTHLDKGGQNAHPKSPLFQKFLEKIFLETKKPPISLVIEVNRRRVELFIVCWIKHIIKDRLHRVGGLFSYSDIYDFELSFLGWKHLAENIVNAVGVSSLCYQVVLQTHKWLYYSAIFVIIKIDMELFFSHNLFLHSLYFALITETSASTSE